MRTFQELKEVDADAGERGAAVKMGISSRFITRRIVAALPGPAYTFPRRAGTDKAQYQGTSA